MAITNINQLSPELQQAASSLTTPASPPVPAPPQDAGQQDLQNPTEALPLAQPNSSSATPLTPALPNFAPGTFQSKLKAAADQLGIPPGPGGWAKSLVGAAQSALGGVETGLGDVAAAKTEPGNRGILGGVGAVQNARAARQQEQRKALTEDQLQQAQIGKINLDTHYQQLMLHKLEGEINDKANNDAIQNGKLAVNLATGLRTAAGQNPADTIASDISEDQLQRALTDKGPDGKPTWDPNTSTAWETSSYQPIDPKTMKPQIGSDGQPVQKKLYTIIKTPETITLNKDAADLLNENLNPKTPFVEGQSLPGAVGLGQIQQAQNAQALSAKVESDRKKAELDELTSNQQLAKAQASKNLGSDFFHIAAQAGSLQQTMDFITGQHKIDVPVLGPDGKPTGQTTKQIDPRSADFAAKHPTAAEDYMNLNGGYVDYTKMRDAENEKEKKALEEPIDKVEKDLPEMAPDKLPSTISFLQQVLKDPRADKPRVTGLLVQATQAQDSAAALKRREENSKQMAAQGDPDQAAKLLVDGTLTLPELKARNVTPEFIAEVATRATKLDPTFKAPEAEAQAKIAASPANQQFFGNTDSLLLKGGTLDQLTSAASQLPAGQFPIYNKYEQLVSAAIGNTPVARYAAAQLGVADDYAKVMGGSVGTDGARKQIMDIMAGAQSPDQLQKAVIPQVRQQINSQRQGRMGSNRYMRHMYPDPNPDYTQQQDKQNAQPNGAGALVPPSGTTNQPADFFGQFGGKKRGE